MSFVLRSLSARRYRVEGDLPAVHDAEFARRLANRRFEPLKPHEERSVGWVTADNCLDSRFEPGAAVRGPCAVFALRIDRRRVNSRLLRAMLDLELRGRRKEAEASAPEDGGRRRGARVSRDERQELRRQVTEELMRNTSPSLDVHPVLLWPRERLVLFGSLSKPANEAFRALFCDTFDVSLDWLTPYHRALEILGDRGGEALAALRRSEFSGGAAPARAAPEPAALRRTAAEEARQ
jgi:hypothetical protein